MEEDTKCVFCEWGKVNLEYFIGEYRIVKDLFECLGKNMRERMNKVWDDDLDERIKGYWEDFVKKRRGGQKQRG